MQAQEKATVNAIHEDDLKLFLDKLGVLDKIKEGDAKCSVCNKTVELNNISAVYTENGVTNLVCEKDACYNDALVRERDKV